MEVIILIVVLALALSLASGFVKGAGFLVGRSRITWKHSFIFTSILLVMAVVNGISQKAILLYVPMVIYVSITGAIQAMIAGAYFHNRATDSSGNVIGYKKGTVIGCVLFALGMSLSVLAELLKAKLQLP